MNVFTLDVVYVWVCRWQPHLDEWQAEAGGKETGIKEAGRLLSINRARVNKQLSVEGVPPALCVCVCA